MERNYGIECLRIISMIMVVVLHILGQGGILENSVPLSFKYNIGWLLEISCMSAINIFALITGFLLIDKNYKIRNVISIWYTVIFYSLLITILFLIFKPDLVTVGIIKASCFPTIYATYWYYTAYIGMIIFIPYLNRFLKNMSKEQYVKLILLLIVAFSFIPSIFRFDTFNIKFGYTSWWLIIMYIIGGYLRFYPLSIKKGSGLKLYVISVLCVYLLKLSMVFLSNYMPGLLSYDKYLTFYVSPLIISSAIGIFIFFINTNFNGWFLNIVKTLGPASFGVYIIHCHPLIFSNFIDKKFSYLVQYSYINFVIGVLLSIVVVFFLCIAIELIRINLFKSFKIVEKSREIIDLNYNYIKNKFIA